MVDIIESEVVQSNNYSTGWLDTDIYSTAWVAIVPDLHDKTKPAWPSALDFIRSSQLEDGGWGDPLMYYAHGRTISTLAALIALRQWQKPEDEAAIQRGLNALASYAYDLGDEAHEPIGFELLFPSLLNILKEGTDRFPSRVLKRIHQLSQEKLGLIHQLIPDIHDPQAWWFSMEMLPTHDLACISDAFFDEIGSIATSPAATAAALRAQRMSGRNEPAAETYLDNLLVMGNGAAPFAWPAEIFADLWVLDTYRRANMPLSPAYEPVLNSLSHNWYKGIHGLPYSQMFPMNDGDISAVGYTVLKWAGYPVSDEGLLALWSNNCTKNYPNERGASVSTNIHLLTALRFAPHHVRNHYADRVIAWLKEQAKPDTLFDDKWHLSPFYPVSHALTAFLDLDKEMEKRCYEFILEHQHEDGGWGWHGRSTLEESGHCILALNEAYHAGLMKDIGPLKKAARLFQVPSVIASERMWIGKALYRPVEIVETLMTATRFVLKQHGMITE